MSTAQFYVWLIKTYCRHIPCGAGDQQTYDALNPLQVAAVDYMLDHLRELNLVLDDVYRPAKKPGRSGRANFIVYEPMEPGRMETRQEWLAAENNRLIRQLEQMMRDQHRIDGERARAIEHCAVLAEEVERLTAALDLIQRANPDCHFAQVTKGPTGGISLKWHDGYPEERQ